MIMPAVDEGLPNAIPRPFLERLGRRASPDGAFEFAQRTLHAPAHRGVFAWLLFFTIGRPLAGVICLILQVTLIGWIPAALWAVYALSQFKTDEKISRALRDIR